MERNERNHDQSLSLQDILTINDNNFKTNAYLTIGKNRMAAYSVSKALKFGFPEKILNFRKTNNRQGDVREPLTVY